MRLPDFIVIGEMRCGSTTLWELLSRHPRVFFSEEKEVHFFDGRHGKWEKGVEWYADLFAKAGQNQFCGEATPDYLFHDHACQRIHQVTPDAKLLVILRDPVERAWSHYWHNVRRGRETLDVDSAFAAEAERMKSDDADVRAHFSYASRGRYIETLKRYADLFGKDRLCVVFLEDLKKDPKAVMSVVCKHVGLDEIAEFADPVVPERNKAKYPRWPKVNAAFRGMRTFVKKTLPFLDAPVKLVSLMTRPFRVYSGSARMSEEMKARLRSLYVESDKELATWLGRPLPWAKWKNPTNGQMVTGELKNSDRMLDAEEVAPAPMA